MEELLKERKQLYKNIDIINKNHEKDILIIEDNIEKINNLIYELCEHQWVHDRPCAYDKMETYCNKCYQNLKK